MVYGDRLTKKKNAPLDGAFSRSCSLTLVVPTEVVVKLGYSFTIPRLRPWRQCADEDRYQHANYRIQGKGVQRRRRFNPKWRVNKLADEFLGGGGERHKLLGDLGNVTHTLAPTIQTPSDFPQYTTVTFGTQRDRGPCALLERCPVKVNASLITPLKRCFTAAFEVFENTCRISAGLRSEFAMKPPFSRGRRPESRRMRLPKVSRSLHIFEMCGPVLIPVDSHSRTARFLPC